MSKIRHGERRLALLLTPLTLSSGPPNSETQAEHIATLIDKDFLYCFQNEPECLIRASALFFQIFFIFGPEWIWLWWGLGAAR